MYSMRQNACPDQVSRIEPAPRAHVIATGTETRSQADRYFGQRRWSPGHDPSEVVEVMQAGTPFISLDRIDQVRNAFPDGQARRRTAHIGLDPSWRHQ